MKPREYQAEADQALWELLHRNPKASPLVILPTGTGKSLCLGMLIWRMIYTYPNVRIMATTHVKELIENNYKTLKRLWPQAPAGIYSAGLGRKEVYAQITFSGIQSVANRAGRFGRIDFLLIDEAHLVGTSESATYLKFIHALRANNPNLIVIGFTATAFRTGMGMLTEGGLFDEIAYDGSDGESFVKFIEDGYLIRPVPKDPGFQLDSSAVKIDAGEFNTAQASRALHEQDILERAVDTSIALGEEQGRRAWLTFCQSIEDAELVADMFRYKGYPVEAIHSKRADRDEVLAAFKRGELRGVTNRDILTTGFDHPPVDMITMLRLTRSPGLWVQMLGRGTRPVYEPGFDLETKEGRLNSILASPKQSCLVLDFVGNTKRLGPINYPVIPKRRKAGGGGGGEAPVRLCPICSTYNHITLKACEECGHEFPPPERLQPQASEGELVKTLNLAAPPQGIERIEEIYGVNRMVAIQHPGKAGKPPTMKVDYFCGFNRYSTWVCFSHPANSYPRKRAEDWWRTHGGQGPAPISVENAVAAAGNLSKPKFIKVWVNTKYPEIVGYDFRGTRFNLPPELGGPPLQEPDADPLSVDKEKNERALKAAREMFDDIPF